MMPKTIPAVANPCPLSGESPALISRNSAAPSHQAKGASNPHKINPKIPNTNDQIALLLAGSRCMIAPPLKIMGHARAFQIRRELNQPASTFLQRAIVGCLCRADDLHALAQQNHLASL
jgi:hypothetical protein